MPDREKVIKGMKMCISPYECSPDDCPYYIRPNNESGLCWDRLMTDALALLEEQEKKETKLHKKHVLTLNRNDEFSMRKLYESVCEKLLDEGEMVITRTDNHENVEFVFYVVND